MRHTTPANFNAILNNQSGCTIIILYLDCTWVAPGDIGDRPWGEVSEDCTYDPTPGSTAAWRYGATSASTPTSCSTRSKAGGTRPRTAGSTAAPTSRSARTSPPPAGTARTRGSTTTATPTCASPARCATQAPGPRCTVERRLLDEEDGAGELADDADAGDATPVRADAAAAARVIRGRHGSPCTCAGAPPVCASGHRPRPAGGDARGVRRRRPDAVSRVGRL